MSADNVFVIVDGEHTRYNKRLKHSTIRFDMNDPKQMKKAKNLAFEILSQIETYIELFCEEEGEE
jgi:hypothetical protein